MADALTPFKIETVRDVPESFARLVTATAPSTFAISGGGTARRCYERLRDMPGLEWPTVEVLVSDERWVPVTDPDSNEGQARRALFDEVHPRRIHSLRNAGHTIEEAAQHYESLVRELGSVDLLHLGLGVDGHTASLFPGSPALEETRRLVVPTGDDTHPHQRLTFTFPAIAMARLVVLTVEGAGKREALLALRAGTGIPAARVRADRVLVLVDQNADA